MRTWSVRLVVGVALCLSSAALLDAGRAGQAGTTFDAVSIKKADLRERIDMRFLPSRFVATNVTLELLIEQAYGLEAREVVDGPDWVRGERFDVVGTIAAGNVGKPEAMLMLQALLADRFKLQLGTETRTGSIYELTVVNAQGLHRPTHPDEQPRVQGGREDAKGVVSFYLEGHNATMGDLAVRLAGLLRTSVTDQTDLAGHYDFRIDYTTDSAFGGLEPDPDIPTIFTSLQRAVGLKLVPGKGPIELHVIGHVERPTED